jgi:hypothetical protein
MTKLVRLIAALATLLCGCSKHNVGNNYYFSFQSGNIQYSTPIVDSLFQATYSSPTGYGDDGMLTIGAFRDQQDTDSAEAGLSTLATCYIYLWNFGSPANIFSGDYTTDSSSTNLKRLDIGSDFRFYSAADPHKGQFLMSNGLPFTVTITHWTSSWFEGTFEGKVAQFNSSTSVSDTATITNGKFMLPLH